MKILNFGSCNIDIVYSLHHIATSGETEIAEKMEVFPGGKGLNQSIAVSKAGSFVYHAGCVGSDGDMLRDVLEKSGVDTCYLKTVPEKSGHAVIQVSQEGENSIFLYPGSNQKVEKPLIDHVLKAFSRGDLLLLQNEISNVEYIIDAAFEKGMQIVFNPSPFDEKIKTSDLNKISYLVLNEAEAKEFSGFSEPEKCLNYFGQMYPALKVILTLGAKGSVFMDDTQKLHQYAYRVDVLDETAASDAFMGYFVSGVAQGKEYKDILKIASAASALTISRRGAAPSIPEMQEVLNALTHLKQNAPDNKTEAIRRQIERYIEEHLKDANLSELSVKLGYSTVYTGSLVKRVIGKSFSALLQAERCKKAADELLNSDMSVKEIIDSVGYENESFFREKFKAIYGKAPLAYRKAGI